MDDEFPEAWPSALRSAVQSSLGPVQRITALGGMSGADVHRVTGPGGSRVVKHSRSSGEAFVYRDLAPALRDAGVRIPGCDAIEPAVDGSAWLLLEDVPHPLPRNRWGADREVVAVLSRLHRLPVATLDPIAGGFLPTWGDDLDRAARARLPATAVTILATLRETFDGLVCRGR